MLDRNHIQNRYNEALRGLQKNVQPMFGFSEAVLIEGSGYNGIWLECGPLEGLVYGRFDPAIAVVNHQIFFHHQREDGYIPYSIKTDAAGTAQIQMVVPIAATALETAELTGNEALLAQAYHACAKWDDWLVRNRDTRGTGLCELFCAFDTGHDNSPRVKGIPIRCPDANAAICPSVAKLPYLAPDLSATVYGGRCALARMAGHLGKPDAADAWQEKASQIRQAIIKHCYDPGDECFYDVDCDGKFIKIRGDVLSRVFSERVVDQAMFERIYRRHIRNPDEFWTPYPLPSIAVNDPEFVSELPHNSWGGAAQALTALRAPRWFGHYGKSDDLRHLMTQWVKAILSAPGFMQQMNPWTGEFIVDRGGYSPAMCVFVDFVDRLGLLS